MSMPNRKETASGAAGAERLGLPAWVYRNEEFFALERERIFMRSWQVVCHVNDVPEAGDYHLFDFCGEPVFVMRGRDGALRAFYNVCRHRAARLLDGEGRASVLFVKVEMAATGGLL